MNKQLTLTKCLNVKWEGHADCQHCAIRKNDIFANLDVAKYAALLRPILQYNFPAKALLYAQGTPATDVYVIRNGIVKLEETLSDGSVRIVRLLQSGDAVGIETVLDAHQSYDQTAVILRGAAVCKIPSSVFVKLEKENPEFHRVIMEEWHRQLNAADKVIVDFSTGTVHDRVARVLINLAENSKKRNLIEIEMLGVEDIAALTSVARESISRVMANFKRDGLLEKSGPNRMRYNWDGLNDLVKHS